jgi:hypothetical protein
VDPEYIATATATASPRESFTANRFKRTYYPWATLRDCGSHTISTSSKSCVRKDGLAYIQVYNIIKGLFEAAKVFAFNNPSLENLALDPDYTQSLYYAGRAVAFDTIIGLTCYLHAKERVYLESRGNRKKSYEVREEYRITLALLLQVC